MRPVTAQRRYDPLRGVHHKYGTATASRINENGGAEGDRTPDLSHAMRTLSQLSYGPIPVGRRLTNRSRPGWQAA
ncbi:hypothetical protein SPHINGOT1_70252 [Sphingomonas sp. T1]|nr:hypothetical protein SPHINGOT1_70252 [Sphingomonas sp. T1]